MEYFISIPGLDKLEKQNDWEGCRKLLVEKVQADPFNAPLLCRLIGECWFILVEWNCMKIGPDVDSTKIKDTLVAATKYGLSHFFDDINFLWQIGYMMALFSYYFCEEGDNWIALESLGKEMVKKAKQLCPDDEIIQSVALGFELSYKESTEARKPLRDAVLKKIGIETELERYFREVLS